ncbi:MAG: hypothetical protein L0Y54_03355 [Sporichthyaceae bacterium]|nr:hypothetical protein [Sporichthyaceae bacterium]
MFWQILWALIIGVIIGSIAKLLVPGRQDIPLWMTALLGAAGALIGNWLASLLGVDETGGVDWIRHLLQLGAAAALIALTAPMWMRRHHEGGRGSPRI